MNEFAYPQVHAVEHRQHLSSVVKNDPACRCEAKASASAFDKARPKFPLQRGNLPGDGWLSQADDLASPGEACFVCYPYKSYQLVQLHGDLVCSRCIQRMTNMHLHYATSNSRLLRLALRSMARNEVVFCLLSYAFLLFVCPLPFARSRSRL